MDVVLDGPHKTRVEGKHREIPGAALALRTVFVRLLDKRGYILAEWMLLTNVPAADADSATIGVWYYFRWRIESFFKLLKSAGHELEYWRQTTGKAILRRLLIASMACVFVWRLQRDKSEQAAALRALLMKLSGRQTKYSVLLAGWQTLLAMLCLLDKEASLGELRALAETYAPKGFLV